MEQWKFKSAETEFRKSKDILQNLIKDDPKTLILWFHNQHGLTMAKRFTGDATGAAMEYRGLANDVARWFDERRQSTTANQDMSEVQDRLRERWFDSMERLVDCNLFADPSERTCQKPRTTCDARSATVTFSRKIRGISLKPGSCINRLSFSVLSLLRKTFLWPILIVRGHRHLLIPRIPRW